MSLPINSWLIDIIVVVVLIISILIGLMKGFLDRAIRFVSLLLVLLLAYKLHGVFLFLFNNLSLPIGNSAVEALVLPIVKKVLSFIVMFIVLMIIRGISLLIAIPIIQKISETLVITDWADKLLGAIFNMVSSLISIYFCLVFLTLPIFSNGAELVNNSISGDIIMRVGPNLTEKISQINSQIQSLFNNASTSSDKLEAAINMLEVADSLGVLNEETITSYYEEYEQEIEEMSPVTVSQSEYDKIKEVLDKYQIDDISDKILQKLEVE